VFAIASSTELNGSLASRILIMLFEWANGPTTILTGAHTYIPVALHFSLQAINHFDRNIK
jgi:hypothetical protein